VRYRGEKYRRGQLSGVTAPYAAVTNVSVSEGRFITESDNTHRRDVIVIGPNVVAALFPNQSTIVGSQLELVGRPFEVIGVLEKRKATFFGESQEDNALYIPFETGRKLSPQSTDMMLQMRTRSGTLGASLNQVEAVLRRQRGLKYNQEDDFDRFVCNRDLLGRTSRWWDRSDEHHAGQRYRAHTGDRHPQSHRGPEGRYRSAVPV
jgi:putative ABC transport system permease protein